MRDVLPDDRPLARRGRAVALATVVRTWGSAPRAVGREDGDHRGGGIAGSVSGGCVEGAVVEAGAGVLASGRPRLLHFGVADDTAWEVGLACGGMIEVFVEPLDAAAFYDALRAGAAGRAACRAGDRGEGPDELLGRKLLLRHDGRVEGSIPRAWTSRRSRDAARRARRRPLAPRRAASGPNAGREPLVDACRARRRRCDRVAASTSRSPSTALAQTLGYRTVVVDPRQAFGNAERFPHADRVVQAWPDEALGEIGLNAATAVAVLTHDPKLDDPALREALPSPAFYVGALGSKATQEKRRRRLLEAGLSEAQLARLHAPIGLELGGRSPEEIALVGDGADRGRAEQGRTLREEPCPA